jgi:YHS domain-containing protein
MRCPPKFADRASKNEASISKGGTMTKDPVCGMQVDDKKSEFQSQYGGKQYTFCSPDCKDKFEKNPEHFAQSAA